jgi:predicted small secreted protein
VFARAWPDSDRFVALPRQKKPVTIKRLAIPLRESSFPGNKSQHDAEAQFRRSLLFLLINRALARPVRPIRGTPRGSVFPAHAIRRSPKEAHMKNSMMKNKWVALLALLMLGSLAGCNTMQGLGKDIERGGEKLQNSSKNTQEKM